MKRKGIFKAIKRTAQAVQKILKQPVKNSNSKQKKTCYSLKKYEELQKNQVTH